MCSCDTCDTCDTCVVVNRCIAVWCTSMCHTMLCEYMRAHVVVSLYRRLPVMIVQRFYFTACLSASINCRRSKGLRVHGFFTESAWRPLVCRTRCSPSYLPVCAGHLSRANLVAGSRHARVALCLEIETRAPSVKTLKEYTMVFLPLLPGLIYRIS